MSNDSARAWSGIHLHWEDFMLRVRGSPMNLGAERATINNLFVI